VEWVDPLIAGAAGVAGALIGAFAVLRSAREERRAQSLERDRTAKQAAHGELVTRLAAYLDAVDRLVDTIAEIPASTPKLLAYRRYNPILRLMGPRVSTLLAEESFASVSRRFQDVGDNFYAARARLRLIAPPEVLDLMDRIDDLVPHRKWRHVGGTILPEYQSIREQFVAVARRIAEPPP
jgi:hypothetical protein